MNFPNMPFRGIYLQFKFHVVWCIYYRKEVIRMRKTFVTILSLLILLVMSPSVLANEIQSQTVNTNENLNVLIPDEDFEAMNAKLIETIQLEWGGIKGKAAFVKTTNTGISIYSNRGGLNNALKDINSISGGTTIRTTNSKGEVIYLKTTPAGTFNIHRSTDDLLRPWTLEFGKDKIRYYD